MKRLCGDCEYSFETIPTCYVCDLDDKPIHLDQERSDCPLKPKAEHVPCRVCSHTFFKWNNTQEVMTRVCKSCKNIEQIENVKEAA